MKSLYAKSPILPAHKVTPLYDVKLTTSLGERVFADPRALRSLLLVMDQHAVNGGAACHWGGPAALAEIVSALHTVIFEKSSPWTDYYNVINDIGHAENIFYCAKALWGAAGLELSDLTGFRSLESKLTGHGENHLFPEGVLLSNGPLGSALPQAQGLAMADAQLKNSRVTITCVSDGASMEGEAKEAFAEIPGLRAKQLCNPFVMIVSDNNTKLSGRIDEDAFSMEPTFDALATLGWHVIKVSDGHDLALCYESLQQAVSYAESEFKPVCLWVKTIKGKGILQTEQSSSGGHGYPLKAYEEKLRDFIKEVWREDSVPSELQSMVEQALQKPVGNKSSVAKALPYVGKPEKIQVGIAKAMKKAREEGLPVVSLSADLQGSTGVAPFHKEFAESSYDMGVAESNMVSAAAGMSKQGLIPVVDTFAAFGVTKGNLPLVMAALSQAPVIGVFSHTGFQDAADGASHQSFTYFSALCSVPYTKLICLSSSEEAEFFMYEAIKRMAAAKQDSKLKEYSYIFFLGRENFFPSYGVPLQWDHPTVLFQGDKKDILIAAYGSTVVQSLVAAHELKQTHGIGATVVHHSFCNSQNISSIAEMTQSHNAQLLTVEDHQVSGGKGHFLIAQLVESGVQLTTVRCLGMKGEFGRSAYTANDLYCQYGFDDQAIIAECRKIVERD